MLAAIDEEDNPKQSTSLKTIHQTRNDVAIQTASYVLEILTASSGCREYCLAITIQDEAIVLWYYDACGASYTVEYLSILEDFEKFAAIVLGFASLSYEKYGFLPPSIFHPDPPYRSQFPPKNLSGFTVLMPEKGKPTSELSLDDPIFTQYTLAGRRTFVYKVANDSSAPKNTGRIVKMSYQALSSTVTEDNSEVSMLIASNITGQNDACMSSRLWSV